LFQSFVPPDNPVALAYRDASAPLVLDRRPGSSLVFAQLETTYLAGFYRLDPVFELHLKRVVDSAYRIRDIAPDAFHRSRYFIECFGATTLIDEIAFVVTLADGLSLSLFLGRAASSSEPIAPAEILTCQRLAPVIVRLARAHGWGLKNTARPIEGTPACW
jgi:hypothetical protein